jgi:hypothetical protein
MPALMAESTLDWDGIQGRKAIVPRHVVWRSFAAETVLLNIDTGIYHGLDEVSGHFFETLRGASTVAAATATLVGEYEESEERIREDMVRFCAELRSLGLIEFAS